MKVNYKKIWIKCAEREMNPSELRKKANISTGTFTKLKKNEEVSLAVLLRIADVFGCNAGDILDFVEG